MEKEISLNNKIMYIKINDEIKHSTTVDEVTTEITVGKVQNGWIITKSISGYRGEGENKEYYEDSETYISPDNPLADKEVVDETGVKRLVETFFRGQGMLTV